MALSSSCLFDGIWDVDIRNLGVNGLLGSFSESFDNPVSSAASASGPSSFRHSSDSSEVSTSSPRLSSEDRTITT